MKNKNIWNGAALLTLLVCFAVNCSGQLGGGTETGNPTISTPTGNDDANSNGGSETPTSNDDTDTDAGSPSFDPSIEQPANFTTLAEGSGSLDVPAQTSIIDNEEDFENLWNDLSISEDLPTIDFNSTLVVAVVQGQKSTGGYDIEVTLVDETEAGLTIHVSETSPGESCMVTEAETNPYHIVSVDKTTGSVDFDVVETIETCEE